MPTLWHGVLTFASPVYELNCPEGIMSCHTAHNKSCLVRMDNIGEKVFQAIRHELLPRFLYPHLATKWDSNFVVG